MAQKTKIHMITKPLGEFTYKCKPYDHQQREFERSRDMEYYGLFWEMGTGKSKPIADTAAHLFLECEIDGVLIISDKGAYLNWYFEEIPKHFMDGIPYRMAYWSAYMRKDEKYRANQLLEAQDDMLDILCMNVEALSSEKAYHFASQFLQSHYSLMVIDESTSIKNPKADRTRACFKLGALANYRRVMTGTPITQSPLDLFAQCQFLKPGVLGYTSYTAFRASYAVIMTISLGSRSFPKIMGYQHLDRLTESIQPFTSRILKSECLDLPDKVYETIFVEQTPEQERMYVQLKEMSLLQLEQGLLTSTSALTTINKLHQINCGHVKLDDETLVDIPNNRVSQMCRLLNEVVGKKIIWCCFQHDVELILAELDKDEYEGYAVHYYGKTTDNDRLAAISQFHKDPKCQWFVGTAATGGKAITLVESHTTAYYSNSYNLEDRLQSEDRNHRIGQTNKVTYLDFVCSGTVDVRILRALREKKDLAHQVLDSFREMLTP